MAELIETLSVDPKNVWIDASLRTRAFAPKGDSLKKIVLSMQEIGQLQPIGIMPVPEEDKDKAGDCEYKLIFGENRLLACIELSTEVRAEVFKVENEADFLTLQFKENDDRKEYTPLDRMNSMCLLVDARGLKQKQAAEILGLSKSDASQYYALKFLPEKAKKMLDKGNLNRFQAVALLDVAEGKRDAILNAIEAGDRSWTAKQLADYARMHPVDPATKPAKKKKKPKAGAVGTQRKIPAVLEAMHNTIKAGDEVCEVRVPIGEMVARIVAYVEGDKELNMSNLFGDLAAKYAKKTK